MVGNIPRWYVNSLKTKVIKSYKNKKAVEFTVSMQYLDELWKQQDGKCALSGAKLCLGSMQKYRSMNTASLDRIDSSKGHIKGNVQWIHKHINLMKRDFPQKYFIKICNEISEYQNNKDKNVLDSTEKLFDV